MQIVTLAAAREQGLKHYFTGEPCARGHIARRFTSIRKCMECAREDTMKVYTHKTDRRTLVRDTASYVLKALDTHGATYDYSLVVWKSAKAKVNIVCKRHGVFSQIADNHIQGHGCPTCKRELAFTQCLHSKEDFIKNAVQVWGEVYDYSGVRYRGARTLVEIGCTTHSETFLQTPTNHLSGKQGCPKCNHMKSAPEDAVASYLNIFTSVVRRDRELLKPFELDIVLPEKRLAIEYCGEYFHSSGDQESEAKMSTRHINKHKLCAAQGLRLITIFESEWLNRQYAIKRLLRNAVGKGRGKVMARKCELRKVEHAAAAAFYERYHPQGGAGHGTHYGLFWKDKLVACMRFTEGANDRGVNKYRVWTLSRYATRVTVTGGASKLFAAFVAEMNPRTVKSFSDNRYFSGDLYPTLGFELKDDAAADYMVWHQKLGLTQKTQWQRREVLARAKQLGREVDFDHETDPRTERDMTYLLGARRIYDCGKKTWVWTRKP